MSDKKFVVWKRNDGYVNVSLSMPSDWVTGGAYKTFEGAGQPVTFEKLAEFADWQQALECVRKYRGCTFMEAK